MADGTEVDLLVWGQTQSGEAVALFTLSSAAATVKVATYGARLTSIRTLDRDGAMGEVTLGSDELTPYLTGKGYLGAAIGRFGNRIAGKFVLDGKTWQLPLNNGPNCLHGGTVGFDHKVWQAEVVPNGVAMTYTSPAGEMGFPGTLRSTVTYTLTGSSLRVDYEAVTDAATVVNLTNHTYFNLCGESNLGPKDLGAHTIRLNADHVTPVDVNMIPTGELRPVAGTPFDQPRLGQRR
jgi:aldose 1-epimerase